MILQFTIFILKFVNQRSLYTLQPAPEEIENQLSWINNIVTYAPTCVFFWNTENYVDLKNLAIEPIKKLYSVAASFKPNMILHKFGFYDDTEIVFYDYSKQALSF